MLKKLTYEEHSDTVLIQSGLVTNRMSLQDLGKIVLLNLETCTATPKLIIENSEAVEAGAIYISNDVILYKVSPKKYRIPTFAGMNDFNKFYGTPKYYFWLPEFYILIKFQERCSGNFYLDKVYCIYEENKPVFQSNVWAKDFDYVHHSISKEDWKSLGLLDQSAYLVTSMCLGKIIPSNLTKFEDVIKNLDAVVEILITAKGNGDLSPVYTNDRLAFLLSDFREDLVYITEDYFNLIFMFLTELSESIDSKEDLDKFYEEDLPKILNGSQKDFLSYVKKDGYIDNFIKDKRIKK